MGNVVHLVSESAVEEAWEDYAVLARQLVTEPSRLADRKFNEELALAHERWKRLFLRQEA